MVNALKHTALVLLLFAASACEHIELFLEHTEGDVVVNVMIHYPESDPEERLPSGMDIYWFADRGEVWGTEFSNRNGGYDYLYADVFTPLCLDYAGNENLLFRSSGTRDGFEVYNCPPDSRPVYCDSVTPLPGEIVAMEAAAPYSFYADGAPQRIDATILKWNDTLAVHFYPRNVLREYSFMIYGIEGAQNIVRGGGAISGMSASFRPATGALAAYPSTILFSRVEAIYNGQKGRRGKPWTDSEKALFAAKNPQWDDPETGWKGDWVIGYFSTFGPIDVEPHRHRLTLEAYSTGNNYYYGAWGYWHGEWEDDAKPEAVRNQLINATGQGNLDERLEQQALWRQQNGGFDIVLDNDGHLPFIPDDAPPTEGGFDLSIDEWGDIIDVPGAVSTEQTRSAPRSAPPDYSETALPGFVVNAVWKKDATLFERFFNGQFVYRNENGKYEYQPLQYWPGEGENIKFQAYAPIAPEGLISGLKDVGALDDNPNPRISYAMPLIADTLVDSSKGVDLLVAVQETALPPLSPNVQLNFRHAFARLLVQAKTEASYSDRTVKLDTLIVGKLKTAGTLVLKPDDSSQSFSTGIPAEGPGFNYSADGKVILWENHSKPATGLFFGSSDGKTVGGNYTDISHYVYILPQTVENLDIYMSWTIYDPSLGGTIYKIDNLNATVSLPEGFAFEAGRDYRFRIVLPLDDGPPWGTGE